MTAIFMGFELSATSAIIAPAMITATLGYLTARQLHRQSILDLVGEDEGAVLPSARTEREAEPMRIEVAMLSSTFLLVEGAETTAAVSARARGAAASPAMPVVIRASGAWCTIDHHALEATTADGTGQLPIGLHPALRPLAVVHPDEPLDTALRHLARNPVLPVVSRLDQRQLLGVVTLAGIHRAYGLDEVHTVTGTP
jgi:hypothetical protein